MADRPSSLREAASRLVGHALDSDVSFTAAGIAYYAQVSLLPTLVLGFVAVSTVAGERLAVRALDAAGEALSPAGQQVVREALTGAAGRAEVGLAGLAVFAWGSFRLFRGLKTAFNDVYGESDGMVVRWRDSAVAAVTVAAAVAVVAGGGLALARFGPVPAPVRALSLTLALSVALAPLYYVLPDADVGVAEVAPGAVVTAGGWVLLRTGVRLYLDVADRYAVYGVLGALVLLVTWLYLASFLLVLGAVVNAVLAGRDRPRPRRGE
jgi:YihY family inner membrane protein